MSGTSFSTPAVTGAAAILLSRHCDLRGHPEKIFEKIRNTATPIKSRDCSSSRNHPNNVFGYGLVNCEKLIK